jgi:hypothetical protein
MIRLFMSRWPRLTPVILALLFVIGFDSAAFAVSTADVIEALKYTYGTDKLLYMASLEIAVWNIFRKQMAPMGGRGQFLLPVRTKNAGVFQGMAQGGNLSTRRAQPRTVEASFALQEFHGIVDITWKALQDMQKDEYAFQTGLELVEDAVKARVFRLLNMDLLGYGRGELGILPATDDQATVTVRSMPGVDLGLIVDLMDASDDNTPLIDGQEVTDISVEDRTITTATVVAGSAAGDYYTVADTVSSAGGSMHMLGLGAWVNNVNPAAVVGNPGGIDRAAAGNEFWRASVLANGGTNRPLTEDLLLRAQDLVRERGSKQITDWVSNLAIIRRYHELLKEDQFFALAQVQEMKNGSGIGRDEAGMQSGEKGEGETIYRFSGTPWRAEIFMDGNRLYGLNREHFFIGHGANEVPRPLSEIFDDKIPYFALTGAAKFDIISYYQGELICDRPSASVAVTDVAEQ